MPTLAPSTSARIHAHTDSMPTQIDACPTTSIQFSISHCSLGSILIASSDVGLCALTLGDDPKELIADLKNIFRNTQLVDNDTKLEPMMKAVIHFIEHPHTPFHLSLDVRGTQFQKRVWQALCEIPLGHTASYADISKRIGKPKSMRAVAQACGANSIAVIIPCHRVIRSDGALSGYRWGVERKAELLRRERKAGMAEK